MGVLMLTGWRYMLYYDNNELNKSDVDGVYR